MNPLESRYDGYAYAYPHKTAYGPLTPPLPLETVWRDEDRTALFLYVHIPFCEMRCGFCNLFTTALPPDEMVRKYLGALSLQAAQVRHALGEPVKVARMAIGGGTPTYLEAADLERVFAMLSAAFPLPRSISVETSPVTATVDRLQVLRSFGVDRLSIGIQSFNEAEVRAAGRPQKNTTVEHALARIREAGFPTLNLDLIYGIDGQTTASWIDSITKALQYRPEELYLYPLYVRPLTGLGKRSGAREDIRAECYRAARDLLVAEGYVQVSMRMFRRRDAGESDDAYCCQEDGMVGLGCGARSYTRALHYSTEFAVASGGVREILSRYLVATEDEFRVASHGVHLDEEEQRRRYLIKSLLRHPGLQLDAYRAAFGSSALDDFPELAELAGDGLVIVEPERLFLSHEGMERADAIGPALYSSAVRARMDAYEAR